jgi:AcrR family transcriptional regulator
VVAAGLEILKNEGLDAVTLSAVGERIGLGKVGLYTYVSSKNDLLLAMRDEVNRRQLEVIRAERDLPAEVALKGICSRLVDLMADYGQLMVSVEPDVSDVGLEVGEHLLAILARLGLSPANQLQVYLLISSALRGLVTSMQPDQPKALDPTATRQGELVARSEPERFPHLNALYSDAEAHVAATTPQRAMQDIMALIVDVLIPALRT